MSYVIDGVYYKGDPPLDKMRSRQQSTWKQHDHNRQRSDYAMEIIQPHNRDGTPNEDFTAVYPEESKEYGYLPSDNDLKKL